MAKDIQFTPGSNRVQVSADHSVKDSSAGAGILMAMTRATATMFEPRTHFPLACQGMQCNALVLALGAPTHLH